MQNTSTLEFSGDSLSSIEPDIEPETASPNQANIVRLSNEELGNYVQSSTLGVLRRLDDLRPYYVELWKRFDELKDGETICGCATRKQFCKDILGRSIRSVQQAIYGRSEPKQLPVPTPEPIPSICPVCQEPQPSRGARGRHIREVHPDEADSILGKQVVPEQPKRINKHLVGAEVGDEVIYNSSSGTCSAVIVAIDDKEVTIQTGKTDKSIKRLPLDIDCDTIRRRMGCVQRGNSPKDITDFGGTRRDNYYSHEYVGKCESCGLTKGTCDCSVRAANVEPQKAEDVADAQSPNETRGVANDILEIAAATTNHLSVQERREVYSRVMNALHISLYDRPYGSRKE
jgi:hypothetical protein